MSVSETWLKPNQIVTIEGYAIIRCDRNDRVGGGACLIVHESICYTEVQIPSPLGIDHVTIKIHDCIQGKKDLYVSSMYIPPNNNTINKDFFSSILDLGQHSLILGDLNAHHQLWKSNNNNRIGKIIVELQNENKLIMINNQQPTYEPTNKPDYKAILDFALCNEQLSTLTRAFSVTDELRTDHLTIQFNLNTKNSNYARPLIESKIINKINWETFDNTIKNQKPQDMDLRSTEDLEKYISIYTSQIQSTVEKSTERKIIQFDPDQHLQLPQYIVAKIKNKRKLERELKASGQRQLITEINKQTEIIKNEINKFKRDKWKKQCTELNNYHTSDSIFWKKLEAIDSNTKSKQAKNTTLLINGAPTSDPRVVAEHFAKKQQEIFSEPQDPSFDKDFKDHVENNYEMLFNRNEGSDEPVLTNIDEINNLIKQLKHHKAPGADQINNTIIKKLPKEYRDKLVDIANASIKLGYVPNAWKGAVVRMIPKPLKDKLKDDSYRPISLLNTLSKLLERVILIRTRSWINKNNLLSKYQCGFRNFRQTRDQIIRMMQDALKSFNNNEYMGAIFIDIEKAFDKVWHKGLLYELEQHKIPSYLGKWLKSYLTGRHFTIKINSINSSIKTIEAGVPQGSVLGPILFNLYFNKISNCISFSNLRKPPSTPASLALFADDLAAWCRSKRLNSISATLQATLNNIEEWMNKWRTKVSIAKTICTVFNKGKKNLGSQLKITYKNQVISSEQHPKFLGVTLDPSLTLSKHTQIIVDRAQKRINMIKSIKGKRWGASSKIIMTTYKALVRPILEYVPFGTLVLSQANYIKLERIQRQAVRKAYYWPRGTSTTDIYKKYKIESIMDRAIKLTDNYICKAYDNNIIIKEMIDDYNILTPLDEGLYCKTQARTTILGSLKKHNMICNSFISTISQQEQMQLNQLNYTNTITNT